jgi:NADH-quinone oxidoreductase subunit C/D
MPDDDVILKQLEERFGVGAFQQQQTVDKLLSLWLPKDKLIPVIQYLKSLLISPIVFCMICVV